MRRKFVKQIRYINLYKSMSPYLGCMWPFVTPGTLFEQTWISWC